MTSKTPACPQCGQTETVAKVNRVYLEGLASKPLSEDRLIPYVLHWAADKPANSKKTYNEVTFLKQFNPPAGRNIVSRPVNPDGIVIVFSLLAIFLLYKIYVAQRSAFLIALGFMALFYIAYFVGRKFIIGKFLRRQKGELTAKKETEAAIGRWMKLYYCWEEGIVFTPGEKQAIPLDQMQAYLSGSYGKE